jgi:iron complex outermembrane recepter protein
MGLGIPGGIGVSTQATFLDYFRTKASPLPIDVPIEWKGSLGPDLIGTNGGAYDYRLISNFSYTLDKLRVNLGWRYLPKVTTAAKAYEKAVIANDRRIGAGEPGTLLQFTPIENIDVKAYSQFNLSVVYELNNTLSVRAGIDNLFDTQPKFTQSTVGVGLSELSGRCAPYAGLPAGACVNPAAPTLARTGTGTFAKGYNDILGRRFFLGVKANF